MSCITSPLLLDTVFSSLKLTRKEPFLEYELLVAFELIPEDTFPGAGWLFCLGGVNHGVHCQLAAFRKLCQIHGSTPASLVQRLVPHVY